MAPATDPVVPPIEAASISVVVPVYQGERTLGALADDLVPFAAPQVSPLGNAYRVVEVLLVHDGAVDDSAGVMRELASKNALIRPLWLSRNFGQHAATLAGMASTVGEWVVTLDEDGQHDPAFIGAMLDRALHERVRLVYAHATNKPPHGFLRNAFSRFARWVFVHFLGGPRGAFNSFRLIEGEVARGVAAYCGANVYLDVALSWVVGKPSHCDVRLRDERGRRSGYTFLRLMRHFRDLVLSSGTFPLRLITLIGGLTILFSLVMSAYVIWRRLEQEIPVQGWTSLTLVLCLFGGLTLLSLGIIAEYLGFAVGMAMGRPPYLIVSRPREDIGRRR